MMYLNREMYQTYAESFNSLNHHNYIEKNPLCIDEGSKWHGPPKLGVPHLGHNIQNVLDMLLLLVTCYTFNLKEEKTLEFL